MSQKTQKFSPGFFPENDKTIKIRIKICTDILYKMKIFTVCMHNYKKSNISVPPV